MPLKTRIPTIKVVPFSPNEVIDFFDKGFKACGHLFRVHNLTADIVYVEDPESIHEVFYIFCSNFIQIFSKMKDVFPNRPVFGAQPNRDLLVRKGLLRTRDEEWQIARRIGELYDD